MGGGDTVKRRILALAILVSVPFLLGGGMLLSGTIQSKQLVLIWPPNQWITDTLTPSFRWQGEGYSQLWVAPRDSSVAVVEAVLPRGQDTHTVGAQLVPGTVYRWRVRSNPYPPAQSVFTWNPLVAGVHLYDPWRSARERGRLYDSRRIALE